MSAFCFSPEVIDLQLFQLWIRGLNVADATAVREDADPILRDILEFDTADHFRIFEELQPSLEEPQYEMCLLQLPPKVKQTLSETFYSFDDAVMREFIGRKFSSRTRKDLDDVSEMTGIPRRSCLRQFDNLKRLLEAGDELGFQVHYPSQPSIADVLGEEFCVSKSLMTRYESILFLMYHRFNISWSKKKHPYIALRDFEYCASIILNNWCVKPPLLNATAPKIGGESIESPVTTGVGSVTSELYSPFELDVALFTKFRDFKSRAIGAIGDIWVVIALLMESMPERKRVEVKFKPWLRGLLSCATGRDLKDFFDDLHTSVVETLLDMQCDADKLFDLLDRAIPQVFPTNDVQTWTALISVLRPCVSRFANAYPQRSYHEIGDDDS